MSIELDQLEIEAQAIDSQGEQVPGEQVQGEPIAETAPDNAALFAAFSGVALGALKAVRSKAAKRLPTLYTEWSDQSLELFAQAIPPVVNKHLSRLMPLVGEHPEEAALALAALPLIVGYVSAVNIEADKEERAQIEKQSTNQASNQSTNQASGERISEQA